MGLYDTVTVEAELPRRPKWLKNATFQTKDLLLAMDEYRLTSRGGLWRLTRKTQGWGFERCRIRVHFDGDIHLIAGNGDLWCEYRATFRRGKMTELRRTR